MAVEGYEYEPEIGGGKYISLRNAGDIVRLRIASKPVHRERYVGKVNGKVTFAKSEQELINQGATDVNPSEQFGWLVFDISEKEPKVKLLKMPTGVYVQLQNLSEDWGDPREFNVKLERTNQPGMAYYQLTPMKEGMGPLTEAQKKALEENTIDLVAEMDGGSYTKTFGAEESMETAPDEGGDITNQLDSTGDKSDDEVSEEDLPF